MSMSHHLQSERKALAPVESKTVLNPAIATVLKAAPSYQCPAFQDINTCVVIAGAPVTLFSSLLGHNPDEIVYEKAVHVLLQNPSLFLSPLCNQNLFLYVVRYGMPELAAHLIRHGVSLVQGNVCAMSDALYYFVKQGFDDKRYASAEQVFAVVKMMLDTVEEVDFTQTNAAGLTLLEQVCKLPEGEREKFIVIVVEAMKYSVMYQVGFHGSSSEVVENYIKSSVGSAPACFVMELMAVLENSVESHSLPKEDQKELNLTALLEEKVQERNRLHLATLFNDPTVFEYEAKHAIALKKAVQLGESSIVDALSVFVRYPQKTIIEQIQYLQSNESLNIPNRFSVIEVLFVNTEPGKENNQLMTTVYSNAKKENDKSCRMVMARLLQREISEAFVSLMTAESKQEKLDFQLFVSNREQWEKNCFAWLKSIRLVDGKDRDLKKMALRVCVAVIILNKAGYQHLFSVSDFLSVAEYQVNFAGKRIRYQYEKSKEVIIRCFEDAKMILGLIGLKDLSAFTDADRRLAVSCFLKEQYFRNSMKASFHPYLLHDVSKSSSIMLRLAQNQQSAESKCTMHLYTYLFSTLYCSLSDPSIAKVAAVSAYEVGSFIVSSEKVEAAAERSASQWMLEAVAIFHGMLKKSDADSKLMIWILDSLFTVYESLCDFQASAVLMPYFDELYKILNQIKETTQQQEIRDIVDKNLCLFIKKDAEFHEKLNSFGRFTLLLNLVKGIYEKEVLDESVETSKVDFNATLWSAKRSLVTAISFVLLAEKSRPTCSFQEKINGIDEMLRTVSDRLCKPICASPFDYYNIATIYGYKGFLFLDLKTVDGNGKALVQFDLALRYLKQIQTDDVDFLADVEREKNHYEGRIENIRNSYKKQKSELDAKEVAAAERSRVNEERKARRLEIRKKKAEAADQLEAEKKALIKAAELGMKKDSISQSSASDKNKENKLFRKIRIPDQRSAVSTPEKNATLSRQEERGKKKREKHAARLLKEIADEKREEELAVKRAADLSKAAPVVVCVSPVNLMPAEKMCSTSFMLGVMGGLSVSGEEEKSDDYEPGSVSVSISSGAGSPAESKRSTPLQEMDGSEADELVDEASVSDDAELASFKLQDDATSSRFFSGSPLEFVYQTSKVCEARSPDFNGFEIFKPRNSYKAMREALAEISVSGAENFSI